MDDRPEATTRDVVDAIDRLVVAVYCVSAPRLAKILVDSQDATVYNIARFAHRLTYSALVDTPVGADRLGTVEALVEELKAQLRMAKDQVTEAQRKSTEAVAKYDRLIESVAKSSPVDIDLYDKAS